MFRGRPLAEETTYLYDDQGRVTKTRTLREPEFLDSDRWLALGLDAYERSLCTGCGQPRDRAWHPAMAGCYVIEEVVCNSCAALDRRAREDSSEPGAKLYPVDILPSHLTLPPVERFD